MTKVETRVPCPTCLGVMMQKLQPVKTKELMLDYCRRCGGVWFDAGEVRELREVHPKGLPHAVTLRETAFRMPCHSCHVPMDRNAPACPSCGWKNVLDCPSCQKPLERIEKGGLTLDACRSCRGVWFDNHELAEIWNLEVNRRPAVTRTAQGNNVVADHFLLDAFLWAPDILFYTASGVAHGAGALAEGAAEVAGMGVAGVADGAGGAVEAVGDVAGSVFEVVADIIAGLF